MMHLKHSYVTSKSLTLQISPDGRLLAHNSMSRPLQSVELDALPVLLSFSSCRTPEEALAQLTERWDVDEAGFSVVVDKLVSLGLLVRSDGDGDGRNAVALARSGYSSIASQHRMLRDSLRVMAYQTVIARHCKGKTVLDLGCGTGILSVFAARAGAAKVVAIEETEIAYLAKRMFHDNGCSDVVELRLANSRDVEVTEQVDIIIHELIGVDPVSEDILPYIRDARDRFLKPGGKLIPDELEVCCVGFEVEDKPYLDLQRVVAEAGEFDRLYGISFKPYVEGLAGLPSASFPRPLRVEYWDASKVRILTEECRLFHFDFKMETCGVTSRVKEAQLKVHTSGLLGGLLVYFRARLDEASWISTSPFAQKTHWGQDVRSLSRLVPSRAGDEIALQVMLQLNVGRQWVYVNLA